MNKIKNICNVLLSSVYPNRCIGCGNIIEEGICLCNKCDKDIERINLQDICLNCGLESNSCTCKYNIFRFNSLLSIFKNCGIAQTAYYKYKFSKKQHYAKFFASEICNAVNTCYSDIRFDLVCSVPSFKKFGYDHSGYIAKEVAQQLKIPFDNKLLKCIKRTKKQHKSTIKERLINVDGKYKTTYNVSEYNILLIDDIKTTGATLDECAKSLLFAGANGVYCVAVLATQ